MEIPSTAKVEAAHTPRSVACESSSSATAPSLKKVNSKVMSSRPSSPADTTVGSKSAAFKSLHRVHELILCVLHLLHCTLLLQPECIGIQVSFLPICEELRSCLHREHEAAYEAALGKVHQLYIRGHGRMTSRSIRPQVLKQPSIANCRWF
jgi:hypothetical protein